MNVFNIMNKTKYITHVYETDINITISDAIIERKERKELRIASRRGTQIDYGSYTLNISNPFLLRSAYCCRRLPFRISTDRTTRRLYARL